MIGIRFEAVAKAFGSKRALDSVSFEVQPGEILFVLGRSGVGKSVTLKHIAGLMKPDSGRVWIGGEDLGSLDGDGLARVRRTCGMVFQHPALFDSLDVFENVAFGLRAVGDSSEEQVRAVVVEKLGQVGLAGDLPGLLSRKPNELSYGTQKRVSLARTLATSPQALLFDEPTTGLDPISTTVVNELIRDLARRLNVTCVVVSHDMGSALSVADRILVLDEGKIRALGTVSEIKASRDEMLRGFLLEVDSGAVTA